jgi:hypothetical protein
MGNQEKLAGTKMARVVSVISTSNAQHLTASAELALFELDVESFDGRS